MFFLLILGHISFCHIYNPSTCTVYAIRIYIDILVMNCTLYSIHHMISWLIRFQISSMHRKVWLLNKSLSWLWMKLSVGPNLDVFLSAQVMVHNARYIKIPLSTYWCILYKLTASICRPWEHHITVHPLFQLHFTPKGSTGPIFSANKPNWLVPRWIATTSQKSPVFCPQCCAVLTICYNFKALPLDRLVEFAEPVELVIEWDRVEFTVALCLALALTLVLEVMEEFSVEFVVELVWASVCVAQMFCVYVP